MEFYLATGTTTTTFTTSVGHYDLEADHFVLYFVSYNQRTPLKEGLVKHTEETILSFFYTPCFLLRGGGGEDY